MGYKCLLFSDGPAKRLKRGQVIKPVISQGAPEGQYEILNVLDRS